MARKKKNTITISNDRMEDFIWMSYRYCIGRHTIAAAYHADVIRGLIMDNPDCLSENRKAFMAIDIRRQINDLVYWRSNVHVDGPRDTDLYSLILYKGSEKPNEKVKFYVDEFYNTVTTEPCEDDKYVPYDKDYEDIIRWIKLANILDKSTHKIITTNFNGEIKNVECYPYPYKVDNGVYVTKWTSPEKTLVNDSYLADEYIVEIKDC